MPWFCDLLYKKAKVKQSGEAVATGFAIISITIIEGAPKGCVQTFGGTSENNKL